MSGFKLEMTSEEKALQDLLVYNIKLLLVEESDVVEMKRVPIEMVYDAISEVGGEPVGEMDTNGWQLDYWFDFQHKDKVYSVSGSGWYGHVKIEEKSD